MEELEEWTTSVCWSRDKPIQSSHHSCQLLYLFGISRWVQVIYGFDL